MEILQVSIGTRSIEASGSWRTVIGIAFLWPILLALGMIFMVSNLR
jgi:SP family sugar:H+ symporter-like MFS transporter